MKKAIIFLLLFFKLVSAENILSVTFIKQKDEFCGPASLSTVFKYYGEDIEQDEIGKYVYNPKLKGALITDLENFAKDKGFKTILKKSDILEIKSYLDQKKPVIALIDLGFWLISQPHYLVIIGYNDKGFIVNTGYMEKYFISYDEFEKKWEKMGKVILVVYR